MSRKDRVWTIQIQEDNGSWVDVYWCDQDAEAERMAVDYSIKMRKPARTRISKVLITEEGEGSHGVQDL